FSNEKPPQITKKMGTSAGGGGKIMPTRRALSAINKNITEPPPSYPYALNNKRSLSSERNVICNKPPLRRPVTRKFADNKPQIQEEETKKSNSAPSEEAERVDIGVDNNSGKDRGDDCIEPMFIQHTETMIEETYQMENEEEIKVEDADKEAEQVVYIDACDEKNSLAVVEYIDDIYDFHKKSEVSRNRRNRWLSCIKLSCNYMDSQQDLNERMRGILIDWKPFYLTINVIDRFLAVHQIVRKKLQLVGVTALLLACKYEEVSVPVVDDLILISDKAYTRREVLDMEKLIANTLQFNFSLPTPYVFMKRFLKASQSDKKVEVLSFFIIELCLVEYEMLDFCKLAASAIYTAQCTLKGFQEWGKTCEFHTGYKEEQLLACARKMVGFHHKAGTGKLTGVHRKYNTSKFSYAARTKPAGFLL
ncbi:hypothetical protein HID58_065414, partial [Brassica napus]